MAKAKKTGKTELVWDPGEVSDKQQQFLDSKTMFTCYGGAKGGGKSHIIRIKAIGGCLTNDGIRILMMRQTYNDVEENLIRPMLRMLPVEIYNYNGTSHLITFENGSSIKFGHWQGDESETEYNGLEYDWIFIDEATQFTERAFNFLGGCMRGATPFPKRMYLTCNPGGVGHNWVKRLFVDKIYRTFPDDPERDEHAENYTFIFATVKDNKWLLENSPLYLKNLASMPEDLRLAYRYGNWDAIGGNYFPEFSRARHVVKPFKIPAHWKRFRSFDYGLDMFSCFWWAVDEDGRCWAYRHYEHDKLIVQDAARAAVTRTLPGENIITTYAPPDMWTRSKDSGKTLAEIFTANGLPIIRSDNSRVQGHMMIKEMLAPKPLKDPSVRALFPKGKCPAMLPGLMFFDCCDEALSDLESIQADKKNPNDCAKEPHDITHNVDSIRYFCITRQLPAEKEPEPIYYELEDEDDIDEDYDSYMCGHGEVTAAYLSA